MTRVLVPLLFLLAAAVLVALDGDGPRAAPPVEGGAAAPVPSAALLPPVARAADSSRREAPRRAPRAGVVRLRGAALGGPFHLLALPADADERRRPEVLACAEDGGFVWPEHDAGTLLVVPRPARLLGTSPPGLPRRAWIDLQQPLEAVVVPPGTREVLLEVEVDPFLSVLAVDAEGGAPIADLRLVAGLRVGGEHAWYPLSCGPDGIRRMPRAALAGAERVRWTAWEYPDNREAGSHWEAFEGAALLARERPLLLPVVHARPLPIEFVGPDGPILAGVTERHGSYRIEGPTADGAWLFQRSAPQRHGVTFEAQGFLSAHVDREALAGDALRVEMRPEVRLDVVLEGARSPSGWTATVRFDLEQIPADRTIRGAYPPTAAPGEPDVAARARYTASRRSGVWTLDLAPRGRRTLVKLASGGEVELELAHFGHPVERRTARLRDGERTRVVFSADAPERTLACEVVDASGAPVADVEVQVAPARQGRNAQFWYTRRVETDWLAPRLRTGADGAVVAPLPPGDEQLLRFRKQGFADTVRTVAELREGGGRVVLEPGRDVVLTLLDADGERFFGGWTNGTGAYYSMPWVHLGGGLWRAGERSADGPGGEALEPFRDWLFRDLPAGALAFRVEDVPDFELVHDTARPRAECRAPVRAADIRYGK